MKKNIYSKLISTLAIISLLCSSSCSGSNNSNKSKDSKEIKLLGGDAICYNYCLCDFPQLATVPIISNVPITSAKLNNVVTDTPDIFKFEEASFDLTETFKYNGYYVYFLVLSISCENNTPYKKVNVEKVILDVNGEQKNMLTPTFQIENGVDGIEPDRYNNGTLLYGGSDSVTLLRTEMPSKKNPAEIAVISDRDVTINSYSISNYFDIEEFTLNGDSINPNNIDFKLKKDEAFVANYTLNYKNGSNDSTIVRSSQILTYTDRNGKGAFISECGEYLYLGQDDQTVLKNYIDNHK